MCPSGQGKPFYWVTNYRSVSSLTLTERQKGHAGQTISQRGLLGMVSYLNITLRFTENAEKAGWEYLLFWPEAVASNLWFKGKSGRHDTSPESHPNKGPMFKKMTSRYSRLVCGQGRLAGPGTGRAGSPSAWRPVVFPASGHSPDCWILLEIKGTLWQVQLLRTAPVVHFALRKDERKPIGWSLWLNI